MMEYIFFSEQLRDDFVAFARELGVECTLEGDEMGQIAAVPEDLPDEVCDRLEARYDELMEAQADLVDQEEDGLKKHVAALRVELDDGRPCMIPLPPDMMNRLLSVFTLEEVQALVTVVARSVANPSDGPVCQYEVNVG